MTSFSVPFLCRRYEIKVKGNGFHQLIVKDCEMLDAAQVSCACMSVKTEAKLAVRKKEGKPQVEVDDDAAGDGTVKGRFKGTIKAEEVGGREGGRRRTINQSSNEFSVD